MRETGHTPYAVVMFRAREESGQSAFASLAVSGRFPDYVVHGKCDKERGVHEIAETEALG